MNLILPQACMTIRGCPCLSCESVAQNPKTPKPQNPIDNGIVLLVEITNNNKFVILIMSDSLAVTLIVIYKLY